MVRIVSLTGVPMEHRTADCYGWKFANPEFKAEGEPEEEGGQKKTDKPEEDGLTFGVDLL